MSNLIKIFINSQFLIINQHKNKIVTITLCYIIMQIWVLEVVETISVIINVLVKIKWIDHIDKDYQYKIILKVLIRYFNKRIWNDRVILIYILFFNYTYKY